MRGHPAGDELGPLLLGAGEVIRAYAVLYQGVQLGPCTHFGHSAPVREHNVICADCSIGSTA